ncbi:MAG: A/G-specific adenine glycosylase [Actinomycetota bacterium]
MGRLTRDERIVAALLPWGGTELRDLPWRRTRDPWAVLVSEFMLQQTSVARVLPKYGAFMHAFPLPGRLASAPLGEALQLWQGLGYPRRCRNLRDAAAVIVGEHGGDVPSTLEGLLALPGVGQYTARAVLAFAHGADAAVVDTNVSRVLSRLDNSPMNARRLQARADALVPQGQAWEWNQVMMDLGARVCTARSPSCASCPVARQCLWRAASRDGAPDPAPSSAGASRPQARFEGSDRQARGNAMRALAAGCLGEADVIAAMGLTHDDARARRLVDDLVREGLAARDGGVFRLP